MNNWREKISKELITSPVGEKLNGVLDQYDEILSEFLLWVEGKSLDGNIIYATADEFAEGYNLYAQYKEQDTDKTIHFSVLNNGNLVLLEVSVPEIQEEYEDNSEWVENYEFGYEIKNDQYQGCYYQQSSFVDGTLLGEYNVSYDKNGEKMVQDNMNIMIEPEDGYSYHR